MSDYICLIKYRHRDTVSNAWRNYWQGTTGEGGWGLVGCGGSGGRVRVGVGVGVGGLDL